jgi:hypothetical protein
MTVYNIGESAKIGAKYIQQINVEGSVGNRWF